MSIKYINTGSSPNKGDGDTLRTAFTKINSNFSELYGSSSVGFPSQIGQDGKFLTTVGGNLIWSEVPTPDIIVTGTTQVIVSNIEPSSPRTGDLWYDIISGRTYVWYDTSWVDANPRGASGTQLPDENGHAGEFLTTDGSNLSWVSIPQTTSTRVHFNLYGTGETTTATTTITSWIVNYQIGTSLNTSTFVFIAPTAGIYITTLVAGVSNNNGLNQVAVLKNDLYTSGNVICFWETDTNTGISTHFGTSGQCYLDAGDTLSVKVLSGSVQINSNDSWSVTLLG